MAKNINKTVFDGATRLKLRIFGECFEEWLPVFNYDRYTTSVHIFDLFAGSGKDLEDYPGSPLILLDKAKGEDRKYCRNAKKNIHFHFNDKTEAICQELKQNIESHIEQCKKENNCVDCIYKRTFHNDEFRTIFANETIENVFIDNDMGKFILLDQYGFKEIDEDVFKTLIFYPKTDFIFFISSSFINRFREHPNTTRYIDTSKINFENIKANEIHRAIAKYFRDLIPSGKEYYLHHFSIKKEEKGNYYGLIFGSSHTLGMEKFLKVCWKHDKLSGEANYNIDNNWEKGTWFYDPDNTIKKNKVSDELRTLILNGEISDNIEGLKTALCKGCEPKLFTDMVKNLEKEHLIKRTGEVNNQSTNIHKVKEYYIERLNHET